MAGQILVISGPSGSGKSTLLERLLKEEDGIYFSISSTTRDIRDGEKNGVNYHYISQDEFKQGIENGDFLEWAKVHKNYYGTSLKPVKEALEQDKIVIFDIDIQGFKIVMSKFADITTSLFITTKDQKELKKRLQNRGTDSDDIIEQRIFNAVGEMEHILEYDYFFINDDLEQSYKNLRSILNCMRIKSSNINLRESINNWLES